MWVQMASMNARSCDTTMTVSSASWSHSCSQVVVSRSRWLVGSSSSSRSAGAMSCAARPTRPRSPPESVETGVIDVAPEVGEALLVVPELLEERVRDAFPQLTQLDRLFGDALLERD